MKKVFYISWVLLFVFCLFVLIGGKFKSVGRPFLAEDEDEEYTVGDLCKMCLVDDYRERIDKVADGDMGEDEPEEYDIIAYGDSFFRSKLQSPRFADELARLTGKKVYYVTGDKYFGSGTNPLIFLKQQGFQKGKRKLLIYEIVERYSIKNTSRLRDRRDGESWQPGWKEWIFDNKDVDYFFKNNLVVKPFVRAIANLKFHLLDEIDPRIGRYSRDPKMLFYQESMEFNRRTKGREEAGQIEDNIRYLQEVLDREYNMDLVFMIIPNKYSIYGDYDPQPVPYDNFLSLVAEEFDDSPVPYIDVYGLYSRYRQSGGQPLLYYMNDTHFTPTGKQLILDRMAPLVRRLMDKAR